MPPKHVLVTGGAGFIGSHVSVLLTQHNYQVTIIDNLSNSDISVIKNINRISSNKVNFLNLDIRNKERLNLLMQSTQFQSVIHLAGDKSISDSINKPAEYYDNNVIGTISLINSMLKNNIYQLIFSSSASVYGSISSPPFSELSPVTHENPYAHTKLLIEDLLRYTCHTTHLLSIISLRYFNPVGAHPSGLIGERLNNKSDNIFPKIIATAKGKQKSLSIFGNDYPTKDGTGIRDFIHVMDLAEAHIKAMNNLTSEKGFRLFNIGTGVGYSVKQIIKTFEEVTNIKIPIAIKPRRSGDVAESYSNPTKASKTLHWQAQKSLSLMCQDAWNWSNKEDKHGN